MVFLSSLLKGSLLLATLKFAVANPPNILFILTDDQDWHMQSMVRDTLAYVYLG
jgi:hypothetical protein